MNINTIEVASPQPVDTPAKGFYVIYATVR